MAESNREEIAKLEMIYANNPGGRVFTHLAEAYRKAGELDRARTILQSGIGRHPDYASAHVVLGRVLMDLGSLEEAASSFRRVLALDPENRVALRTMGDLARHERPAEALDHYRQLQSLDPSDEDLAQLIHSLDELVSQQAAAAVQEPPATIPAESAATAEPVPDPSPVAEHPGSASAVTTDDWSVAEAELTEELPGDLAELTHESAIESATPEAALENGQKPVTAGAEEVPVYQPKPMGQAVAPPQEPMAATAEFPVSETEPVEPPVLESPLEPVEEVWTGELSEQILPLEVPQAESEDEGPWFTDVDLTAGPSAAEATPTFEALLSTNLTDPAAAAPSAGPGHDLPTETLAELYRTQGFYERSAGVYRALLEHRPDDQRLRRRLREVEDLERAARVEPVSGLSMEPPQDLAVFRDVAPVESPFELNSDQPAPPGVSPAWVEDVESAWTGGAGVADVADSPYAWELDQDEDNAGPSLADYLSSVLAWRPTTPMVTEPEPAVPIESLLAEEIETPEAGFDSPDEDAPIFMEQESSWPEDPEPWAEPAADFDSPEVPQDAWAAPTPMELETAEWEPVVEASIEESTGGPEAAELTDAWDQAAEPAAADALPEQWLETTSAIADSESDTAADHSVEDAFEEWFTSGPEDGSPVAPAATAPVEAPVEPVVPVQPLTPAADASDDESDDDLEMFRSWLQSLKR